MSQQPNKFSTNDLEKSILLSPTSLHFAPFSGITQGRGGAVVIVGPPNSGKTTIVPWIVHYVQQPEHSRKLVLPVTPITLDLLEALKGTSGKHIKHIWTSELA